MQFGRLSRGINLSLAATPKINQVASGMATETVYRATTTAPVNIAVVKYKIMRLVTCLDPANTLSPGTGASEIPSSTYLPIHPFL